MLNKNDLIEWKGNFYIVDGVKGDKIACSKYAYDKDNDKFIRTGETSTITTNYRKTSLIEMKARCKDYRLPPRNNRWL